MEKKPYVIALFFFFVDFISKQIVVHMMKINDTIPIIRNFFNITYVQNTGAAWSILKDQRILLLIVPLIALFIINKYMNKEKLNNFEMFIYGMIIGGIFGNLFDRLIYSSVIDFLDFTFFGYNYPIFNLADSFIVIGIILLIIISIKGEYYGKNRGSRG